MNITLLDGQGNSITQLDSPLTICLALPNTTKKGEEVCLSYYDERKDKWICEDECLTTSPAKGNRSNEGTSAEGYFLCGRTAHLTNFALLLTGNGADSCQPDNQDSTLAWISLGMVIGAILLVALCGFVIEMRIRWRSHRKTTLIRMFLPPFSSPGHSLEWMDRQDPDQVDTFSYPCMRSKISQKPFQHLTPTRGVKKKSSCFRCKHSVLSFSLAFRAAHFSPCELVLRFGSKV